MGLTKQEVQRRLHQLTPARQQEFHEKQHKFMADTVVEIDVHKQMPLYRQFSLMHTNEVALDVTFEYWHFIFRGGNDTYKIIDVVTFLRAADPRTYREWINTFPYNNEQMLAAEPVTDWKAFRDYNVYLSGVVNPLIEKETERLLDSLLRQQSLEVTGQSKSIPLHKR